MDVFTRQLHLSLSSTPVATSKSADALLKHEDNTEMKPSGIYRSTRYPPRAFQTTSTVSEDVEQGLLG